MAERIPGARVADTGREEFVWMELEHHLGSRLAHHFATDGSRGFATVVADKWLELDSSPLPAAARIEQLIRSCVEVGAGRSDVVQAVDGVRARLSLKTTAEIEREARARAARRRRLSV